MEIGVNYMDNFEKELTEQLKSQLKRQKNELEQQKDYAIRLSRFSLYVGITMILIAIGYIFAVKDDPSHLGAIGITLGMGGVVYALYPKRHQEDIFIKVIKNELSLLDSPESRSETLFRQHHFDLNGYYELNLKQNKIVFKVGIICIILGFVVIGVTFVLLASDILKGVQTKMIVAAIGALGAILSNFIAAIYLKMHTNTIKTMTEFHNRYVNTNHLYFSNYLISNIKDDKKREETLATLALNLSRVNSKFDDNESK
ncbi:hypothetical protein UF14_17380 [Bacillus licheniformis]|nr:hypothetical protein UF14_17380 [Bacillus licheniformis]